MYPYHNSSNETDHYEDHSALGHCTLRAGNGRNYSWVFGGVVVLCGPFIVHYDFSDHPVLRFYPFSIYCLLLFNCLLQRVCYKHEYSTNTTTVWMPILWTSRACWWHFVSSVHHYVTEPLMNVHYRPPFARIARPTPIENVSAMLDQRNHPTIPNAIFFHTCHYTQSKDTWHRM